MTKEELIEYISPRHMWEYAANEERARSNERETIEDITIKYGLDTILSIVDQFIIDFISFVKSSKKPTNNDIRELSLITCIEYKYIKITELPIFFCKLKAGKFGKFYNNLDPQDITSALCQFANDSRAHTRALTERETREKEEKERESATHNAIRFETAIKEGLLKNLMRI